MARIRTLKPDFWSDSKMVKLSPFARLFYLGMWNFALCERGHLQDDADDLKLKILPGDAVDPAELLGELLALGRVQRRQTVDGRTFLLVPKLPDHQKVDPRWKPRCPYCSLESSEVLPDPPQDSPELPDTPPISPELPLVREGKGREGKGVPPSAGAVAPRADDTAQPLIGEWIEHCRKRPPGNVIGQISKQVKILLDEGIEPGDVRRGLAAWHQKGVHPSVLPSIVNELMNATGPARASPNGNGPPRGDIDWQAAMQRARDREAAQ